MANEAVIIEYPTKIVRRTVADSATIEKGTILKLTDPNTAAASSANGDIFAGIAMAEKVASDGSTTLACAMDGVFDIVDSGATVTAGNAVSISGANIIRLAIAADFISGCFIGYVEESATSAETIRVRLRG